MRRFMSVEEILAEPGFEAEQPVSLDIYRGLVGWYSLPPDSMRCCAVAPGKSHLCKTKHGRGWVARVDGGALSVIGGDCAKKKFDADTSIMVDIRKAQVQIDEAEQRARFDELLEQRNARLEEQWTVLQGLEDRRKQLSDLYKEIGEANRRAIVDRSRNGRNAVDVVGTIPAEKDENGDITQDARAVPVHVGQLPDIRACNPDTISRTGDALRALRKSYEAATPEVAAESPAAMRKLAAALSDHDRVVGEARSLIERLDAFLAADLTPIAFLVHTPRDRQNAARVALLRLGSAESPKNWIQRKEAELSRRYRVSRIRID